MELRTVLQNETVYTTIIAERNKMILNQSLIIEQLEAEIERLKATIDNMADKEKEK